MRDVRLDSGCELAEFNGEPGHVHLLASFPPAVAISRPANSLEGAPSRRLGRSSPGGGTTGGRNACGYGSYFAGSAGSVPISVLRQYIEQQDRPAWPTHVRPPSPPV